MTAFRTLCTVVVLMALANITMAQQRAKLPEMDMAYTLKSFTARCSLARIPVRIEGRTSAQISRDLILSGDAMQACIDKAKVDGREVYRKTVLVAPASRAMLQHVYALWLGYANSMIAHMEPQESVAQDRLEAAINDMQARLDTP
ncbi:hypothetical protein [Rhodanobacter lindaniclasticus]|nr:hypothetical protein [Rhodanobacter lindaniclasticus]